MRGDVSRRRVLALATISFFSLVFFDPAGGLSSGPAMAQDAAFPTRPVTLIVPFPAGGGNDATARVVADKMSGALGQQVIVDNRGGGGGNIGTRAVARAVPDGYTLLLGYTGTLSINPSVYRNAGYDPRKDFAPIGMIGVSPSVFVVNPKVAATSIAEFITLAKATPGKLDYASSSAGTVGHIMAELFAKEAGIKLSHIPYKGTAPALNDLVGGHVSMMIVPIVPVLGNVKGGTLRALGVTSKTRSALLPDVPTVAEAGLPGFSAELHYGLLAPAGTPPAVVAKLNAALNAALANPDVKARFAAEGLEPRPITPQQYAAAIDTEEKTWGSLVRSLDIKVE